MKNTLLKVIIAALIIPIFTMSSLFQASASAAVNSTDIILDDATLETEITKETEFTTQDLPPRNPPKDPFWIAFAATVTALFGAVAAETIISNAVNNGIEWTCDKYGHITGVKQACRWIAP